VTEPSVLEQLESPGGLTPLFQPIFDVKGDGNTLHALEVLMRGPRGTNFEHAGVLFEYVRRRHEEARIDRACFSAAFEAAAALPGRPRISVNIHASTLSKDREFPAFLQDKSRQHGFDLSRLIVEIVEHTPFWDMRALLETLESLRRCGVEVALDDVGVGQSNYRMMVECRPNYLKLDRYFMLGGTQDPYRQAVIASLAGLARTLGARVVAEGVEFEADLRLVCELGVDLVQGYLMARPLPPGEIVARGFLETPVRSEAPVPRP
jgi:EAL domain-containing protein (putative c-di-GMP-specific phosphodiesterase class I)